MTPTKKQKLITHLIFGSSILLIASCSQLKHEPAPLDEAEACNQLQQLIPDHAKNFIHFRKNKRYNNMYSVWDATKVFPTADICKVIDWGAGLHSYYCNWKTTTSEEVARSFYKNSVDKVNHCLNKDWLSVTKKTNSGGEYTLFSKLGLKTHIRIRTFKKSNNITDNWVTSIIVGDKSKLVQ